MCIWIWVIKIPTLCLDNLNMSRIWIWPNPPSTLNLEILGFKITSNPMKVKIKSIGLKSKSKSNFKYPNTTLKSLYEQTLSPLPFFQMRSSYILWTQWILANVIVFISLFVFLFYIFVLPLNTFCNWVVPLGFLQLKYLLIKRWKYCVKVMSNAPNIFFLNFI